MSQAVEPNRIPASPIMEVVRGYLATEGVRSSEGASLPYSISLLAERADLNADTLMKTLEGRMETIDFDVADRLLCVMNLNDLWLTDLAEVYSEALLEDGLRTHAPKRVSGKKRCLRVGCSIEFVPSKRVPQQKYCSDSCRKAENKAKTLGCKVRYGPGHSLLKLVCRNGHPRTPENTKIRPSDGAMLCQICIKGIRDRYNAKRRLQQARTT